MPNYRIVVEVDPARAQRGSREVENSLDRVERRAQSVGVAMTRAFAFLGIAGGLAGTIGLLKSFEQEMSTIKGITRATEAQFKSLRDEAARLGATTRFSATQAAEGMTFLARAGFNVNQVLGATEGTLRLAQAGALDLGTAADIASNILTGFRLEVDQTARVVDVLALASNSANTTVGQLGEAMKFVAPVAAGMGVSVETATAAVSALSDAGLQASLAGTGLRRVLSELESPSAKTAKTLAALGVSTDQVKITSVGLVEAMKTLRDAGVDTGLALEIFGDRGGPAFEVMSTAIPKIERAEAALRNAEGTADRLATTMDDNLNGAMLGAASAAEGLVLAFGESGATGALRGFFELLAGVLRAAEGNVDVLINALTALTIVLGARLTASAVASAAALTGSTLASTRATAAAIALTLSTTRLGAALAANAISARAATVAITGLALAANGSAAAGRGLLALFGGPLGLAIAAVTTAVYLLWNEVSTANAVLSNMEQTSRDAVNELFDLEQKAREAGVNVNTLGNAANDTNPLIRAIGASYGVAADEAKRLAVNAREAAIAVAQKRIEELNQQKADLGYSEFFSNPLGQGGRPRLGPLASLNATVGGALGLSPTVKERFDGIDEINDQIRVYVRQIELLSKLPDDAFKPPEPPAVVDPEGGSPGFDPLGEGPGGPAAKARQSVDVMAQFNAQLRDDIELAGLSGAAHDKRAAILGLEAQMGRKLTEAEGQSISAKLDLLAAAQDLADLTAYSDTMKQETALLGLSNREREIASERMRVQAQLGRELTEVEAALVDQRARELQVARDADAITQFADRLDAENDALVDLLPGREARAELLRMELQLGRELDPVERARLLRLLEENELLRDQRQVYDNLNSARDTTIRQLEAIAALVQSGDLSDADARLAVAGTPVAEQLRGQDAELGGDFALDAQLVELQIWTDEQNRIVQDGLAARLIGEEEAAARSVAIEQERQRRLRELVTAQRSLVLQGAQSVAESLASIARDSLGEQSKIYRAMFVASKAFAIADGVIKIQQAIANALSLPFPANIPAIAQAAAIGAGIISNIKAVTMQFAEGGLVRGPGTGTSDSINARLSDGEYVVNARATAQHLGLLEAINSGGVSAGLISRPGGRAVATAGGGGPAGAVQLNVSVENYSTASVSVERLGPNDVRVIAREEAKAVLSEDLGDTFAAEMSRPNSRAKEAVLANTDARPVR